jgi:hypothetical protein
MDIASVALYTGAIKELSERSFGSQLGIADAAGNYKENCAVVSTANRRAIQVTFVASMSSHHRADAEAQATALMSNPSLLSSKMNAIKAADQAKYGAVIVPTISAMSVPTVQENTGVPTIEQESSDNESMTVVFIVVGSTVGTIVVVLYSLYFMLTKSEKSSDIKDLIGRLESEKDKLSCESAAAALKQKTAAELSPYAELLVKLMESSNENTRKNVAEVCACLSRSDIQRHIVPVLADTNTSDVKRSCALNSLTFLPEQDITQYLIVVLQFLQDKHPEQRLAAVQVISHLPADQLAAQIATLIPLLDDVDGDVQAEVTRTLKMVHPNTLIQHYEALKEMAVHPLEKTRQAALKVLNTLPKGDHDLLIESLDSPREMCGVLPGTGPALRSIPLGGTLPHVPWYSGPDPDQLPSWGLGSPQSPFNGSMLTELRSVETAVPRDPPSRHPSLAPLPPVLKRTSSNRFVPAAGNDRIYCLHPADAEDAVEPYNTGLSVLSPQSRNISPTSCNAARRNSAQIHTIDVSSPFGGDCCGAQGSSILFWYVAQALR